MKAKRRWSWTSKNLRKSRSVHGWNFKNAPREFRDTYIKRDRNLDKKGVVR